MAPKSSGQYCQNLILPSSMLLPSITMHRELELVDHAPKVKHRHLLRALRRNVGVLRAGHLARHVRRVDVVGADEALDRSEHDARALKRQNVGVAVLVLVVRLQRRREVLVLDLRRRQLLEVVKLLLEALGLEQALDVRLQRLQRLLHAADLGRAHFAADRPRAIRQILLSACRAGATARC
jgi:hypothetical protein